MSTNVSRALGCLSLLMAFALSAWQVRSFLAVDSCLDAGGSFDYVAGVCDFTSNHPSHPNINIALLGLSLLFAVVGVILVMRRRAHSA